MAKETTSTLTKKYVSAANITSNILREVNQTEFRQSEQMAYLGDSLLEISAVAARLRSIFELRSNDANLSVSGFFRLRGSIIPPENMAILAIDGHLISIPEEYYKTERSQRA